MTPEQRVAEAVRLAAAAPRAIIASGYMPRSEMYAHMVLNAVRAALTSDDPAVVREMAERVGLRVDMDRAIPLPCGHFAGAKIKRIRVSGPWREVPDAN